MKIYKLIFGGGQYEDRWDYSIIFSSFENAKKALCERFFTKTGYDERAWWSIKEGIIDTEEWTTLVEGSIVENHDYDERGYPIGNDTTVTLYTETATHKEIDNWVFVETPIMKAYISRNKIYSDEGYPIDTEETVKLESINEITLS